MKLLREMPVCHYFFTRFFVWNAMSKKSTDEIMKMIGEYGINYTHTEITLMPTTPINRKRIGWYDYVATDKAHFLISYEENGRINFEFFREIDQSVQAKKISEHEYIVEWITLPFEDEINGKTVSDWKDKVDLFFETLNHQNVVLVDVLKLK